MTDNTDYNHVAELNSRERR